MLRAYPVEFRRCAIELVHSSGRSLRLLGDLQDRDSRDWHRCRLLKRQAGFGTSAFSGTLTYSAQAPSRRLNTASPTLNCLTFPPMASTSPANSAPHAIQFRFSQPDH